MCSHEKHSFPPLLAQLTRGAAWAPGQRNLPVIKGSEIDGIISQHCPRPPLPVIVCQPLKNL